MDFFALSLGKALCDASTAIVFAARVFGPSAMRPIGYVLLLLLAVALAFSASRLGRSAKTSQDLSRTPIAAKVSKRREHNGDLGGGPLDRASRGCADRDDHIVAPPVCETPD